MASSGSIGFIRICQRDGRLEVRDPELGLCRLLVDDREMGGWPLDLRLVPESRFFLLSHGLLPTSPSEPQST